MIDADLSQNLLAYSGQVTCIVVVGGLLPVLFRVHTADVRYACYRALLALCLILPWIQSRPEIVAAAASDSTATFTAALAGFPNASLATSSDSAASLPWLLITAFALASGVVVRLTWIGAGLIRLRGLRASSSSEPTGESLTDTSENNEHAELQAVIGTRADIRYIAGLRQPVTFGVWRPLVLLPDRLRDQPVHIRRAVLSHELFHVRRRDWAWLLAEEGVRAVLWFHPAVWWLVSRVQLAREEVVDELAVLATGTRRGYIEALMAFADETPLAPAPAFARRRHLFWRVKLISKEAAMSARRIVLSGATMAVVVAACVWYAVGAFPFAAVIKLAAAAPNAVAAPAIAPAAQDPLTSPGPLEKRAKPTTPENPLPRRISSVDPRYPGEAASIRASAQVALVITVDESGRVGEVRRLNATLPSPRPLGRDTSRLTGEAGSPERVCLSAADAVRRWQSEPPGQGPVAILVTFEFSQAVKLACSHTPPPAGSAMFAVRRAVPPPPPPPPHPRPVHSGSSSSAATTAASPPPDSSTALPSSVPTTTLTMPRPC